MSFLDNTQTSLLISYRQLLQAFSERSTSLSDTRYVHLTRIPFANNLMAAPSVYATSFIVTIQGIFETFVAYNFLVAGWGNPVVSLQASKVLAAFSDLQPLFDALRKFESCRCKRLVTELSLL
jgi:hypothetical protein